jgi:hypothetical protein
MDRRLARSRPPTGAGGGSANYKNRRGYFQRRFKGGPMAGATEPRFRSREAALRFYFRASELLAPNAKPGMFSKRRPSTIGKPSNVVLDFLSLDSCFRGMNEQQLWLLRELYGPSGFGAKPRPIAEVFEEVRRKFPNDGWTPQKVARLTSETLRMFEEHLKRRGLR